MFYTCTESGLPGSAAADRRRDERRLELGPSEAVSVPAVRGTVVRGLRGSVWLTQEGQWRDYILVAGASYVSGDNGKIVLNSLDSASAAGVYRIDPGPASEYSLPRLCLDAGAIARIERDARRARAAEIGRWFGLLADALAGAWRRLWGR